MPANNSHHFSSLWDDHKALNLKNSYNEQELLIVTGFPVGVKIFQRREYHEVAIDRETLFSLFFEAHISKLRSLETSPATLGS